MTVRYRVIWYNRTTDRVGGFKDVPGRFLAQVLTIAGIKDALQPGEFPLVAKQANDIANLIGFRADPSRFEYYLEPMEWGRGERLRA